MLSSLLCKGNVNWNDIEISLHSSQKSIIQTAKNAGKDVGGKETLIHCFWECKLVQPLQKAVWSFLKKLKIDLMYNPAEPHLSIYPKQSVSRYNRTTCTSMFIGTLFTTLKLWNQPGCPPTNEWIKKIWYMHTMDYYLAIKHTKLDW
jgi:hypothetical protein